MAQNKKELLNNLWQDDRSFGKRLLLAIFPCFLIAYMYLIWEPYNMYFSNSNFFDFTFSQIALPFLILGLAVCIVLTVIISLFRGRIFSFIVCLLFGLAVASYLQGMLLNLNLGILDGTTIAWQHYARYSVINALIWFLIILIPFIIKYFFEAHWEKIVKIVSGILIGVQLVALAVTLISSPQVVSNKNYYVSKDGEYTVSANKNVIVILLDYFGKDYIDSMLSKYPDALDAFNDFTYYTNTDSVYYGTFPSVTHLLTGAEMDTTVTTEEWFKQAWNSEKADEFYNILKENNYKADIYSDADFLGGAENMVGKVSNVKSGTDTGNINYKALFKKMITLSMYKYVPHAFKASFWIDTSDFADIVTLDSVEMTRKGADDFYRGLLSSGLTLDYDSNYYIFNHLRGAHASYNIGDNGQYLEDATLEQTCKGYFVMIEQYLQDLKDLGVYDNSTIIITADHCMVEHPQIIYFIKEAGVTHKTMQTSAAPISHNEYMATILANMGVDYSDFGKSIYDIDENDARERTDWVFKPDDNYPKVPKYHSTSTGYSNVYYLYSYTGDQDDLLEALSKEPEEIVPMKDAFY